MESKLKIDKRGSKQWKLPNGKLHRTDGPAVERYDGSKWWYLNDLLHRTDGPAVEWADGRREWWLNGALHRTDGPAVWRSGQPTMEGIFYLEGTYYWNVEDWKKAVELYKAKQITDLF